MTQEVKLRRVQCNFQAENARFLLECDFSKQYCHYYRKRLEKTRPFVEFNCRSKWNPSLQIYTLAELATSDLCEDFDTLGDVLSNTPTPVPSPEAANSSFEFAKRMRRLSDSSKQSPAPKTSTQKQANTPQPSSANHEEQISALSPVAQESGGSSGCIVVGTIFKRMKLQPDVVEELSRGDFHVKCERYLGHYTSQDDTLVLEDLTESISLIGNIDPKKFVTGVVIAVLGSPINDGSQFLVRDVCYATPNRLILCDNNEEAESQIFKSNPYLERPPPADREPIYLMVVSGLGFHPDMRKRSVLTKSLQDLIDFIWGGGKYSEDDRSSRVSRILIAGDSLSDERLYPTEEESSQKDLAARMKQTRQVKPYNGSVQALKHMDDFFAQLSKTIDVDVMPGQSDPSCHLLPQQPFHPCMFPKSCMFSTFNCVTNPFRAIYNENVDIFTTSGQNVDIISKFSKISNPIEIMRSQLIWGHCAPSAPDNLYSSPYEDDDPFIIDFIPEIYIAGCQEAYQTDYHYYELDDRNSGSARDSQLSRDTSFDHQAEAKQPSTSSSIRDNGRKSRTLLLTVPKFCETYSCVLINLLDLESQLIKFG